MDILSRKSYPDFEFSSPLFESTNGITPYLRSETGANTAARF
jgi:hypothetical protein